MRLETSKVVYSMRKRFEELVNLQIPSQLCRPMPGSMALANFFFQCNDYSLSVFYRSTGLSYCFGSAH